MNEEAYRGGEFGESDGYDLADGASAASGAQSEESCGDTGRCRGKRFPKALIRRPGLWTQTDCKELDEWAERGETDDRREERKDFILIIQKPGKEWGKLPRGNRASEKYAVIRILNDDDIRKYCIEKMRVGHQERESCWQGFMVDLLDPEKSDFLDNYDPSKGSVFNILLKALDWCVKKYCGKLENMHGFSGNPCTISIDGVNDINIDGINGEEPAWHERTKTTEEQAYSGVYLAELKQLIISLATTLPEPDKTIIYLYLILGKYSSGPTQKIDECIAKRLTEIGIFDKNGNPYKPGNIRVRLTRIKQWLKARLIEHGYILP